MRTDLDDAGIRAYLLGLLPEADAEALEDAFLGDPEVWQRVRGVEDDLLDDYAAGRLGADERRVFESRYLASPPLRERVAAARALRLAAAAAKRRVTARPGRWRVPLGVAAAVVLVVAAVWNWAPRPARVTSLAPPSPASAPPTAAAPPPPIAAPRPPLAAPASPSVTTPAVSSLVLALSPVLLRGQARPTALRIPAGMETVVFELEGDPAALPGSGSRLVASIETVEGAPVWHGEARRATRPDRPSLLASAHVPSARLAAGDYLVTLSAGGADGGALYRYFFRVVP